MELRNPIVDGDPIENCGMDAEFGPENEGLKAGTAMVVAK